ncbi:MAG: hypothetical protein EOO38_23835, partial [Cytophagaceae bacterium]
MLANTWAPRGQTPILVEQAGRAHLSLIAAIAPNGRIYVAGQDQSFTGEDIVWFLNKLCGRYRKRNMLLIWDGAAIHRSEAEPWNVTCIETGEKTMTGGRLKRAAEFLGDDTFCLTYGDGVSNIDITASVAWHKSHGKLAT